METASSPAGTWSQGVSMDCPARSINCTPRTSQRAKPPGWRLPLTLAERRCCRSFAWAADQKQESMPWGLSDGTSTNTSSCFSRAYLQQLHRAQVMRQVGKIPCDDASQARSDRCSRSGMDVRVLPSRETGEGRHSSALVASTDGKTFNYAAIQLVRRSP
eukprot:scaffold7404_cov286-Pinguiococcus_pyrenoidosus.AAC.2